MSGPLSPALTTIPLSPLKSTFSIYSLPAKDTSLPSRSISTPRKGHPRGEYVAYLVGLVACACVCSIGSGSVFAVLGGLILGHFFPGYLSPSNTQLNVVPILVGGPILGLPAGIVAAWVALELSMTRTVIVVVIMVGFTLASAFAFPVGVLVLQRYRTIPSGPTPVQALAASGTGCAACLTVVVLLYATYRLVFVVSKLSCRSC